MNINWFVLSSLFLRRIQAPHAEYIKYFCLTQRLFEVAVRLFPKYSKESNLGRSILFKDIKKDCFLSALFTVIGNFYLIENPTKNFSVSKDAELNL
jgi:hypothetical protein